ncbi:uncharacterized protein LOC143022793 [Oratosquilla oratoria]|uniref:uncharacterized protein LOC143022793 n=1 Tax=Oratosquilla oratoria TaxID=337810 RepID=UPI003F7665E6
METGSLSPQFESRCYVSHHSDEELLLSPQDVGSSNFLNVPKCGYIRQRSHTFSGTERSWVAPEGDGFLERSRSNDAVCQSDSLRSGMPTQLMTCSTPSSKTSLTSIASFVRDRLGKSSSYNSGDELDTRLTSATRPRFFSLRLSDGPGRSDKAHVINRVGSTLRRAFSAMSLCRPSSPSKPVQRLLRPPRRRHQNVRGLSGLPIESVNLAPQSHVMGFTYYMPLVATVK